MSSAANGFSQKFELTSLPPNAGRYTDWRVAGDDDRFVQFGAERFVSVADLCQLTVIGEPAGAQLFGDHPHGTGAEEHQTEQCEDAERGGVALLPTLDSMGAPRSFDPTDAIADRDLSSSAAKMIDRPMPLHVPMP